MTGIPRLLRPLESSNGAHGPRGGEILQHAHRRAGAGPPAPSDLLGKRATCSQCRIRKVRCDGRRDGCGNCERLSFECSFRQLKQSSGHYVLKPPEPRRRTQACTQCHIKKTRCLGELPSCSNCVRKGRGCTYPKTRKHSLTVEGSESPRGVSSEREPRVPQVDALRCAPSAPAIDILGSADGVFPDLETAMELVDDYFHHLYPLPSFAFLHQPTVVQRCKDKSINEPLRLAICALTALQLRRSSLCHDLWVQQAEQVILQQIGRPSIFHLQALLLIIRYRIESGEFPTAFMLAALAARAAVALRLNYERSELLHVAQEARRRLFWSLYLLDDFFCVGLREFELCPEETIHMQLPCDDDLFEAGQFSETGFLRFIRRVGLGEEPSSSIGASIRQFEGRLQYIKASLRQTDQYSVASLAASPRQAQYIMVHMSWHQCHCDLYRIFMDGYSEAAPSPVLAHIHPNERADMQQRCLEHAEGIVRILTDFANYGKSDCLLERDAARKELERLISSHSVRLALQMKEGLSEFDAPPQRVPSGVSQFANSRQKLSIQSLLLQSDFVDDSHEIAAPSPGSGMRNSGAGDNQPLGSPGKRTAFSNQVASAPSRGETWNGLSQEQTHVSPTNQCALTLSSHYDVGQQRSELVFNPWMGFPGTEDLLISGGMNDDY
ncbi:hypothetical protein DL766_001561 [Monosporascus sp. MC13-8B]|uniref:Zn(2)-C6 fungal-type domain-containing protein n=1 Tax=Monosporascus cannonballus TaxID=155416 RepID=A0ABY0H2G9_9PEZI|nr:hypothetical protein DL762_007829 [Monosporascus cannonballus]RYO90739.1 hypothetical protein DL763_005208 [Monosporascus cannonballus]RYP37410.1 hypothetical protein DL766_001561 [Monosporascus sp. MC13-8B]